MSYRKFCADNIFTGTNMLNDDHVLITNENGVIEDIVSLSEAGNDILQLDGILTPGFINCHCHLELSHMKGLIPEKTGLVDFVFSVVTKRHFNEEEILDAICKAEDEMLGNGIVAAGDICNTEFTIVQKLRNRLAYYNFIEVSGWLPEIAKQGFERSKIIFDKYSNGLPSTGKRFSYKALVPHAPYSVSNELWELLQPSFGGKTICIHNQETSSEDELFIRKSGDLLRMYQMMHIDNNFFEPTGKSSLKSYLDKLKNAKNVILVHNTFIEEEDIFFAQTNKSLRLQRSYFCICINANLYIENKIPPIDLFRKHGCNLVLGTDSLASNHNLSILDEIRAIRQNFPFISLEEILRWATVNGARALQMEDQFGSFEKGKQPGIIIVNKNFCEIKRLL